MLKLFKILQISFLYFIIIYYQLMERDVLGKIEREEVKQWK